MKAYLAASFILLCSFTAECQTPYQWFNEYNAANYALMGKLAIDKDGNLFTIGNFSPGVTVGGTFVDGPGSLLIKLNAAGEVIWFHKITYSTAGVGSANSVATDANSNVYVIGNYWGSATVAGTTLNGSYRNCFLAKFNNAGDMVWIRNLVSLYDMPFIAVNDAGDIALSGPIGQFFQIENVSLALTAEQNSFAAVFNTDGQLQWAKGFGNGTRVTNFPISLTLDSDGNFFLTGRYSQSITIDDKAAAVGTGNYNLYITRINRQGACQWIIGGHRKVPAQYEQDAPESAVYEYGGMTTDNAGNAYVTGSFWNEFTLGSHNIKTANDRPENFFVVRINADGTIPWINTTLATYGGSVTENVFYKQGKLYTSGTFGGSMYYKIIDPETGVTTRDKEILPLLSDLFNGIAVDDQHNVYMSGRYYPNNFGEVPRGFVFKIAVTPPSTIVGSASPIESATEVCENGILVAAVDPVDNATSYEWEVTFNGTTEWYQTTEPTVEIPVSSLGGASSANIRVRGINGSAFGTYSITNVIVIRTPDDVPVIKVSCNEIQVVEGNSVSWYIDGVETQSLKNEHVISPPEKGSYYVTWQHACGTLKSNIVEYKPIFVPNVITPNGDLMNETFILDQRLQDAHLSITNRWGHKVFSSNQYQNDWSGFNMAAGVYFYSIVHPCFKNNLQGSVTVSK